MLTPLPRSRRAFTTEHCVWDGVHTVAADSARDKPIGLGAITI